MTLEVMMALLFISSTLTSLTVECIKRFYNDANKEYSANVITGVVALVVGFGVGITYCSIIAQVINLQVIVWLGAMVYLSWLCAMLGYDKVKQTITQIRETLGGK